MKFTEIDCVIEPEFSFWKIDSHKGGHPISKAIGYPGDNNGAWLTGKS